MSLDDIDHAMLEHHLANLRHHVLPGGGWMHTTRLADGTHDTTPVVAWLVDSHHNLRTDMPIVYGVPLVNVEPCGLLNETTADGAVWHPDEPTPPAWVVDYLERIDAESMRLERRPSIEQQIRDAAHDLDELNPDDGGEGGGDMPRPGPAAGSKGAARAAEDKFPTPFPDTPGGPNHDR